MSSVLSNLSGSIGGVVGGTEHWVAEQWTQRVVQISVYASIVFFVLSSYPLIAFVEKHVWNVFGVKLGKEGILALHSVIFGLFMYVGTRFILDPMVGKVVEGSTGGPCTTNDDCRQGEHGREENLDMYVCKSGKCAMDGGGFLGIHGDGVVQSKVEDILQQTEVDEAQMIGQIPVDDKCEYHIDCFQPMGGISCCKKNKCTMGRSPYGQDEWNDRPGTNTYKRKTYQDKYGEKGDWYAGEDSEVDSEGLFIKPWQGACDRPDWNDGSEKNREAHIKEFFRKGGKQNLDG